MTVRLYGRSVGHGSLSVVTSGFRQALSAAGLLEGEVSLDRTGGSEEEHGPPGALARDGVFVANLSHTPLMQQGAKHERHWVQVTPNSTQIPKKLLAGVLRLPNVRILSASGWGARVIEENLEEMGVKDHPEILTVHHGVSGFRPYIKELTETRMRFDLGHFDVVHFSTSDGERKGTLELLNAWQLLQQLGHLPDRANLTLVLDHHARHALMERLLDHDMAMPDQVTLLPRADMDSARMSSFLCQHHLLCTPSRGEGFGLTVLESRACGVPVATTQTTGHSSGHAHGPGVLRIKQEGSLEPIDDGPGAMAPPLRAIEIAKTIRVAIEGWPGLQQACEAYSEYVRADWSWEKQLAPLVAELRKQ